MIPDTKMFLRNCIRCDKRFRPNTQATKLCEECHTKATSGNRLKKKSHS